MKLSNALWVTGGLLLVLTIGTSSVGASPQVSVGDPQVVDTTPNTDCDETVHTKTTDGDVEGCGTSAAHSAAADKSFARNQAERKLKAKLGRVSGIICKICPDDGLQCERNVAYTGETTETCEDWIDTHGNEGFKVCLTYNGEYKVSCSLCPTVTDTISIDVLDAGSVIVE